MLGPRWKAWTDGDGRRAGGGAGRRCDKPKAQTALKAASALVTDFGPTPTGGEVSSARCRRMPVQRADCCEREEPDDRVDDYQGGCERGRDCRARCNWRQRRLPALRARQPKLLSGEASMPRLHGHSGGAGIVRWLPEAAASAGIVRRTTAREFDRSRVWIQVVGDGVFRATRLRRYPLCEGLKLKPDGPVVVNTHPGRVMAGTLTDHIPSRIAGITH